MLAAVEIEHHRNMMPNMFFEETRSDDTPLPSLTRKQWLDFLRVCNNGNLRTVTPSFRLGMFELTVKRLCDLGAMREPMRIDYNGRQVWDAKWIDPPSLRVFRSDPMAQYKLFSESMKRYSVDNLLLAHVGHSVDSCVLTLSGALCLAHRAGLAGFMSWIADPKDRLRFFNNTTSFFQRTNGIF